MELDLRALRLPTPWRRKQRSRPERVALSQMNSRVTANKSSIGSNKVLRSCTTTASCAGVSVVCKRCGVCDPSATLSLLFHLRAVDSLTPYCLARLATEALLAPISARTTGVVRAFLCKGNHHGKAPGWIASVAQRWSISCRMTSRAMNKAYRFTSMRSSGTRQLIK